MWWYVLLAFALSVLYHVGRYLLGLAVDSRRASREEPTGLPLTPSHHSPQEDRDEAKAA